MMLALESAGASRPIFRAPRRPLCETPPRDADSNIRGARLIRLFATAVYHLPSADAVARIALLTSPNSVTRLATSVRVAQWLTRGRLPHGGTAPGRSACHQPRLRRHLLAVPASGRTCRLIRPIWGSCFASCISWTRPRFRCPAYQPLVSVRRAIDASRAIDEEERGWLRTRCEQLLAAYCRSAFNFPTGMIHGDAWRGNLLRDGKRVVLADWDTVSTGYREIDLIPTLQAPRFGLRETQCDAFVAAYGRDIRSWDGYPVLRDMRELSTLSAILRDGHADAAARRELVIRLRSLRTGDDSAVDILLIRSVSAPALRDVARLNSSSSPTMPAALRRNSPCRSRYG